MADGQGYASAATRVCARIRAENDRNHPHVSKPGLAAKFEKIASRKVEWRKNTGCSSKSENLPDSHDL